MISINASKARANLFNLINLATEQSEPVLINGKRNSAVLVSESDWRDIQETLYLLSIPGMRESIIEGMNTAIEDCSDSVGWCCVKSFIQKMLKKMQSRLKTLVSRIKHVKS